MGGEVEGYQFEIDDFAISYGRFVQVVHRSTEYDHDVPHHHWYRTKDVMTGETLGGLIRGDCLKGPLSEMEVLAWVSS